MRLGRHFAHHERNRRQRRPQLVRGRRSEAVDLREMLRASKNQLGRGQGAGGLPRLRRHPIRIKRHERGADPERHPSREDVHRREDQAFAAQPRHRQAHAQQSRRAREGETEQAKSLPQRQRRGGDRHRRQQQNDERIGDAAGEKQKPGEL